MLRLNKRAGFTFAEILFAVTILAVAVTTVVGVLATAARRQNLELSREIACQLALAMVESVHFRGVAPAATKFAFDDTLFVDLIPANTSVVNRVPQIVARRLTSADGTLEQAVASQIPLWYLRPNAYITAMAGAATPGIRMDQINVVAAFVTDDAADAAILPASFEPAMYTRTIVCWAVEWTKYQDFEDVNGVNQIQGPIYSKYFPIQSESPAATSVNNYAYVEVNVNANRTSSANIVDYGPLALTSSLRAIELARFNVYDPAKSAIIQVP